ncbi:MAG: helix-turn-helix transcriptional regulator [Coriobacteriales bacterium]|jgi:proteasome accessory factor B
MPEHPESKDYKVTKATRLFNLLFFLNDRPSGATAEQIRRGVFGYESSKSDEAFERKFRRDRQDLADMGYTIERSEGPSGFENIYKLDVRDIFQSDMQLEYMEIALLEVCARNALEIDSFFMKNELRSAMGKLAPTVDRLPETARKASSAEAEGAKSEKSRTGGGEASEGSTPADGKSIAEAIDAAVANDAMLQFEYRDAEGFSSTRRVYPISAFNYLGDPYLFAFDADREDTRTFKLERILNTPSLEKMDEEVEGVAKSHLEDDPVVLPFQIGDGKFDAKIYISGKRHYNLDNLTKSQGQLQRHGTGFLWEVDAADVNRLASWVVANGPGILILEPEEVARELEEGLQSIVENGADGGEL